MARSSISIRSIFSRARHGSLPNNDLVEEDTESISTVANILTRLKKIFATSCTNTKLVIKGKSEESTSSISLGNDNEPAQSNPLLDLPVEMLILIASFLPQEFAVLLSLTSKRLRAVLTTYIDASPVDLSTKIKFLLYLQRDLPQYLTCRICGRMYQWRECAKHACPCWLKSYHPYWISTSNRICYAHKTLVHREILDLILRRHEKGDAYGVPVSVLDHDCDHTDESHPTAISSHIKGSIIDGQVIVTAQYTSTIDLSKPHNSQFSYFFMDLCTHTQMPLIWATRDAIQRVNRCGRDGMDLGLMKCTKCATDFRLVISPGNNHHVKVTLKVWRDFGGRGPREQDVQVMFKSYEQQHCIDQDRIAERNLEATCAGGKHSGQVNHEYSMSL